MTAAKNTPAEPTKVGENIAYVVEADRLVMTIDLAHRGGLSQSGKTVRIASTGSNKEVAPGVFLNMTIYTYPDLT